MERCLFALLVLLIFALTIFGLYRVTKHSAAPASPTPKPSPTPAPPDLVDSYAVQGIEVASHQSDTMHWRIERIEQEGAVCYLTKIYLLDPGTQIRKATANWERDIQYPVDMAAKIPDATLFINGSGYVSPTFPRNSVELPRQQPGLLLYAAGQRHRHRWAVVPPPDRRAVLRAFPHPRRAAHARRR